MKHIIIGGVAGGATAAARIRRADECAEIVLIVCQLRAAVLCRGCYRRAKSSLCADTRIVWAQV